MTDSSVWSWSNEDDDLQKALQASLAEIDGNANGNMILVDEDDQMGLPAEVQTAYQKVLNNWERAILCPPSSSWS